MKRIFLLLLVFLSQFSKAQNSPGESRTTSYLTYIYKINDFQTGEILKKGLDKVDESFFTDLIFQYPSDSIFREKFPYGNYLETRAVQNHLELRLMTISNVEIKVLNNGAYLI
jgi:hypothetical protein